MNNNDPFKPLIYIIVSFTIIYAVYSVVFKTDWIFTRDDRIETIQYDYDTSEEILTERVRRSANDPVNPDVENEPSHPLLVLILASNPRSGSTLLSELLATAKNSVLFFEPLWPYYQELKSRNGRNVSDYLARVLSCDYSEFFEKWLRKYFSVNQYYHPSVVQCYSQRDSQSCLQQVDLRGICQEAQTRIAKVMRARMFSVEDLLQDPSMDVKVIHLTRDPRGSITSMQELYWGWNPSGNCADLWQDMQDYDRLLQSYPTKLQNVTHEELCLDPVGTMERINSFLYGHSGVSFQTREYIKKHMNASRYSDDHMSTYKVSSDEYQSWRWKINGRLLSEVESDANCRSAIHRYGHNLFESLENVTDPRVPLETSSNVLGDEVLQAYT